MHICNASVSLKKPTTTAKELNYSPFLEALTFSLIGTCTFLKLPMVFTPFVNNSHGFLYLSSQTCSSNTSLPACSFYYCLTLKKNTTEYEAGGSTALMIMPKCLLTCGFILFLFTCYFCTTFNTERIFFCSLPASPSI